MHLSKHLSIITNQYFLHRIKLINPYFCSQIQPSNDVLQPVLPIFVEHWGGYFAVLPQICPIFNIGGDEPWPRPFSGKQIKWRPKKRSSPNIEEFFSRNLSEDQRKRSSPKIEEFFPRNHAKTTKKVLTSSSAQMQTTVKPELGTCAATIFKRLRWRLCRKYFSNFERNRASAIQISLRLRVIVFQQLWLKLKKNWRGRFIKASSWEIAFVYYLQNFAIQHDSQQEFFIETFSMNSFADFSKFEIFRLRISTWLQNQILKRKTTFVIVLPEIRYSFLKNLKILLRERI